MTRRKNHHNLVRELVTRPKRIRLKQLGEPINVSRPAGPSLGRPRSAVADETNDDRS